MTHLHESKLCESQPGWLRSMGRRYLCGRKDWNCPAEPSMWFIERGFPQGLFLKICKKNIKTRFVSLYWKKWPIQLWVTVFSLLNYPFNKFKPGLSSNRQPNSYSNQATRLCSRPRYQLCLLINRDHIITWPNKTDYNIQGFCTCSSTNILYPSPAYSTSLLSTLSRQGNPYMKE